MQRSKHLIITALMTAGLTAYGCSHAAREETKEAADAVASETKAGAEQAATAAKEAGRDIARGASNAAEKTKEIAGEVADASKRTAEAIGDGWITTKVKAKFLDETVLNGSTVDVDTANHVVTLKGTVHSTTAKERAEAIAKGTEGVTRVVNQLVVK
jgi:hyperosmotically inducible periplasmic protein